MRFASVILDIPTQALDAPYTYAVPEAPAEAGGYDVEVGCAVLVPFGHRQAVGFVVGLQELPDGEAPAGIDAAKVKPVVRAVSPAYFDEEGAACAQWLSERYLAPLSSCVRLFTPPGGVPRMVRAQAGYWRLEEPAVGEVDDRWVLPGAAFDGFEPRKNAVKQASIVEALQAGELRVAELAAEFGAVSSTLKALEKQGVVRIERRRRMRGMPPGSPGVPEGPGTSGTSGFTPSPKPPLTAGQASALAAIDAARERGAGEVVLVDGVTGSGKTEVYLQAIEAALAAGRTACVLVPEISLTPQTVGRFRGRFGDTVAVMHSRMGAGERYDQWDFIRSGAARVVVGARSALFTPLANVGLIVIDEEHEGSYKQDSAPRYHARDVAVWMARRAGAAVVLGSATPSIEALYACAKDPRWHHVELPERANGRPLPAVQVVDMAKEFGGGSRSMFSRALSRALAEELAAGRKAVLLLNQRGFAKFLLCRECGFVPECPSCSTSLTFHERGNFLICHHCGYRVTAPPACPECGSPYLKKFGAGTQRVEADLRVLLDATPGVGPGVPIVRMDADTTGGKGAHQRLLEEFAAADAAVLLGTQMIAKGLDFEDVTLVGVINADTMLRLPDYRAAERTFALVEQVAGRAGRAELPGRVLVQTYEADAAPIRAAAAYDRALFLRDELPKRRMLRYPPYVHMANVLVWGKDEEAVRTSAAALYEGLAARVRDYGGEGWDVLPATPCVLAKLRGTYRWHLVVKCPLDGDLSGVLLPYFRARKLEREVNVAVDMDPDDLL
ncbi:replication restart helicase PriA [Gordonibacter urolithinfaciens]|uniref:Replication restart protein PriA n=1 Tax=Gordonibacter urolithinfaciens TaxID=1335613 RepID=A0A6N8IN15_9ACTN|nr:primosomal protein N' [Gordonibacter urolithinfaciens]MVM54859.1 primosomal protein N' [Gordonibacter urolithinfaciens]MVN16706.1 primosomal protein N' [Gordonibacter urolithinfaciens]MVN40222.1 primosomal protein N' [Gordonibacter urolithinfaciens]MVN56687.1 primosomal protein N' [Gordonibacter urolithinfaciens]MVN62632.1 primosomal protein N' [Gordonibacter urolithinfaciens]